MCVCLLECVWDLSSTWYVERERRSWKPIASTSSDNPDGYERGCGCICATSANASAGFVDWAVWCIFGV